MTNSITTYFVELWAWARANDIPNWVVVAFTGIAWPITLFLWNRRKVNAVPGLEVHFSSGHITIGGQPYYAVDVQFTNHTGSVVYISGVRVRSCTKHFPVPVEASRDIAQGSYHLKFMQDRGEFVLREITIQTNTSAKTCMPTKLELDNGFFTYTPSWVARLLRCQKYFILEYTAMVGTTRHAIATIY